MRKLTTNHPIPLLALALLSLPWIAFADERPNVLFIFSDDHASHAIGAYGGWLAGVAPTPNIDQLARSGMLFENSFCTNSICGPSRAVILTGKHSHLNGFRQNGDRFDGRQQTFPKLLREAGYTTALFGKWHLESDPTGFDHWSILRGQGEYYNPAIVSDDGQKQHIGHVTDVVTDLAIGWLKTGRDPRKPFFLMCQHKAPHRTWMPAIRHLPLFGDRDLPEPTTLFDNYQDNASPARHQEMEIARHLSLANDLKVDTGASGREQGRNVDRSTEATLERMTNEQRTAWVAAYGPKNQAFREANLQGRDLVRWKYQRYIKDYLRCIAGVDESVGRLRAVLNELGIEQNTVVIYASDQGFYLGDHGWYDKRWMYEPSLKMPLIVSWPGVTPPAARDTHLVQNLDYAETFLEIAGVPIPDDMQGRSLVPLLKGEAVTDWRDSIYYHYYEYPSVHMVAAHYGIRTDRYKLIRFYQFGEWEFYDLQQDPEELVNEYANPAHANTISRLKSDLDAQRKEYRDESDVRVKPVEWQAQFR
jgi:arylsulfatase A-like enzyme